MHTRVHDRAIIPSIDTVWQGVWIWSSESGRIGVLAPVRWLGCSVHKKNARKKWRARPRASRGARAATILACPGNCKFTAMFTAAIELNWHCQLLLQREDDARRQHDDITHSTALTRYRPPSKIPCDLPAGPGRARARATAPLLAPAIPKTRPATDYLVL